MNYQSLCEEFHLALVYISSPLKKYGSPQKSMRQNHSIVKNSIYNQYIIFSVKMCTLYSANDHLLLAKTYIKRS